MVVMRMSEGTASLSSDPAVLRAIIASLEEENARLSATLRARDLLAQTLRTRIAKLQQQAFGKSSEKIEREIEHLERALEDLQVAMAEADEAARPDDDAEDNIAASSKADTDEKPLRRRPRISKDAPRERRALDPRDSCPDCGGDLRVPGEDVSELIDRIAAHSRSLRSPGSRSPAVVARRLCRTGSEPSDPARHGRTWPPGLHPHLQVRRSRPALSSA